jgi:ectoine hydroxylase-related dioxygenase (phytanoyl-CoA dioxygenase family)
MTALPGSASQAWHWDNKTRGITIIVPLVDFTTDNGATQLLVGSHNMTLPLVAQEGAQIVEVPTGGVAVFDSRTYHRGLGNLTDETRPALIFCYDRTCSPPPGVGTLGSLANAYLAATLNVASAGWLTLTGK